MLRNDAARLSDDGPRFPSHRGFLQSGLRRADQLGSDNELHDGAFIQPTGRGTGDLREQEPADRSDIEEVAAGAGIGFLAVMIIASIVVLLT